MAQDQNRIQSEEIITTPPLIPFVLSLFMVKGKFRKKERRRRY